MHAPLNNHGAPMATLFQSTSPRGLNFNHPAMRLWQKAKRLGIWDPQSIDLSQDRQDWLSLTEPQRDILLRLTSQFQAGEEAVTLDLLPLIGVVAAEGRLEEEIYLTSFLWEEAKHVEAFRRFLNEVAHSSTDLSQYQGPAYRALFCESLPTALGRLRVDASPIAQAEASVTYNLIVEGVLAETGYHAYFEVLRAEQKMPGMQQIVEYLKRDESRHLAYGVLLLSRLTAEHGDSIWQAIQDRMNALVGIALELIQETFAPYGDDIPFGLRPDDFMAFATTQFQHRLERIEKARGKSLEELLATEAIDDLVSP
jgi:ribonucleoside-diphosphate reductase beta chain